MLRIINMFYNLDHCNKHAHHLLLYEIKDLLLLYISSRRRCISFSHVLYWFSLRLQIALKSQQSKQTYRQNIDSQKSNHCQLSLLYYLKCLAVSWPHPQHYSAVSISLVLSWSFTDAGGAADLCVCVCVDSGWGWATHRAQEGTKWTWWSLCWGQVFAGVLTLYISEFRMKQVWKKSAPTMQWLTKINTNIW